MAQYIIIRQHVSTEVDSIGVLNGIQDTFAEINEKLNELYNNYYDFHKVKIIQNEYLFCYDGYYDLVKESYTYKKRLYFRIFELKNDKF